MDQLNEVAVNSSDIIEAAKDNIDILAALAMPEIYEYSWPPIYKSLWALLIKLAACSRDSGASFEELFAKFALGLPRGFAKSTFIKLFMVYLILYTNRKFILIFCATATHARNALADVADMMDELNIRKLYGDWRVGMSQDTQDMKKFGFRGRNVVLAGIGAEGSVRGLLVKGDRPDIMIFDDIQTKEAAESKLLSDNLYTWMIGTALKAKSPKRCLTLFLANMYVTDNSILKKLKKNPEWTKFIAGGILSDGTSLWEELQPLEQLLLEYKADVASGKAEIFHAEVLNDEYAQVSGLLDLSNIPQYPAEEGDIHLGNFIVIDPSNDKHNSDAVAIGYFELHGASIPCLEYLIEERLSPGDTIKKALSVAIDKNCFTVFVEAVAYQYSLLYWCDTICEQLGIEGISFIPIYPGTRSKISRILDMFKSYAIGEISVHPRVKAPVESQMRAFNPMRTDNVDNTLDLLTYCPKILTDFGSGLQNVTVIQEQNWEAEANRTALLHDTIELSPF